MKSELIRKKFLNFFQSKQHLIVPSAPIVLKDDPTLMFNNSGMAQFKEFFLGNGTPPSKRIADTQKCLRVSGKHNDLEEVGIDTYHHTMFEMLGNWSFGDYFKKDAIDWAWEFLTEELKLDKSLLYVSVFEGNAAENVPFDQEAFDLWKRYVSEDRIILGNKKDNFWEMGDQGPCGPSSEIHVDLRSAEECAQTPGRELVNADHPHVVEIWNLVFMEFNRKADGSLEKLPEKHVDTGMGFERLSMAMQGVKSNYDTDVFTPLIQKVESITGASYTKNNPNVEQEKINIAIRVIADHVRAVAFAIADGQLPSNTGAGYVIRRILRRAVRYGFTFLDAKKPFVCELVATLAAQMGESFPEIVAQQQLVTNVIREEEQAFLRTLDQGLQLLDQVIAQTNGDTVSGQKAFELYDTFGFPIDLTALILRERNLKLDEAGFEAAMLEQKTRSRAAGEVTTADWVQVSDRELDYPFVGYDSLTNETTLVRYRKIDSKKDGIRYQLVLESTPFYPEGGGQLGDRGTLTFGTEVVEVLDTKKENNLIMHIVAKLPEQLTAPIQAVVDSVWRKHISANHSATHLLHQALRHILGTHVEQKGSLVAPGYLRFDFSHFSKVTTEELQQVEAFVNARINENLPLIERRAIAFADAVAEGAMALFGEKYGDKVRAIKFGESVELCGGIHVASTAAIWHFKISSESAVAAGIRRIEAITGEAVANYFAEQENELKEIKSILKNPQDIQKSIKQLQDDLQKAQEQLEKLNKAKFEALATQLSTQGSLQNGIEVFAFEIDADANQAKDVAFAMGSNRTNAAILLATNTDGKPGLSIYISKELVAEKQLNASTMVRELGKYIQGGGGGQPFFATAGGKNPDGIQQAIEAFKAQF